MSSPAEFAFQNVSMYVPPILAHWSWLGLCPHHLSPVRVEHLLMASLTSPLSSLLWLCLFVPYFLLFSLPANHFSAGNVPTQNCFKSFLEHVKIGKQNKTKNKSLLGFQTQAPCCLPRVLPDPGDRAHRDCHQAHTLLSQGQGLWPWGGQGPGLTHPPVLLF